MIVDPENGPEYFLREYSNLTSQFLFTLQQNYSGIEPKHFGIKGIVECICPSPNQSEVFLGLRSGEVVCVNLESEEIFELPEKEVSLASSFTSDFSAGKSEYVTALSLCISKNLLIGATFSGRIKVWDAQTKRFIKELENSHRGKIRSLSISLLENHLVSGGYDSQVLVWNLEWLNFQNKLEDENMEAVECVKISHEEKYVIAGFNNGLLRVWSFGSKELVSYLEGHEAAVKAITMTHQKSNQKLLSAGEDRVVIIWNLADSSIERRVLGHSAAIKFLLLTKDNKFFVTGSMDESIKIWGLQAKESQGLNISNSESDLRALSFDINENYIFSSDKQGGLKIWDLKIKSFEAQTYKAQDKKILGLFNSESDIIECFSKERCLKIDLATQQKLEENLIEESRISAECRSEPRQLLALGFKTGEVVVSGRFYMQFKAHTRKVTCLLFAEDLLISGSDGGTIHCYNIGTFARERKLKGHKMAVTCLVWDSDSRLLSGSKDRTIKVWNIHQEIPLMTLEGHVDFVLSLVVTSKTQLIISGSADNTIIVWEGTTGYKQAALKGHKRDVNCLMLHNDNFLVSGGEDSTLKIWSLKDYIELSSVNYKSPISCMTFSSDSSYIYIGTKSGHIIKDMNFLAVKNQISILPKKYSALFILFISHIHQKKVTVFDPTWKDYVIYPNRLNSLHIFASIKSPFLLSGAIKSGSKFFKTFILEDPLWISVHKKSKQCTEVIIKYLDKYLVKHNPLIYRHVESLLVKLNLSSIQSLNKLYECAYTKVKDPNLPHFGRIKFNFESVVRKSSTQMIDPKRFLVDEKQSIKDTQWKKEEEVNFFLSQMRIPLNLGCSRSIEFLQSLIVNKNEAVFDAEIIKSTLKYKWRKAIWFIAAEALLYLSFICFLLVHVVSDSDKLLYDVFLLIFNSCFAVKEMLLIYYATGFFITNAWNLVETVKILLLFIYLIWREPTKGVILPIAVVLAWIRGIGYFRLFKPTRYLIRLLIEVVKDMGPFLVILSGAVFIFSVVFFATSDTVDFSDSLLNSYLLAYGEFDTANYSDYQKFIFVLASIFNALVLLNMIIAIMGDTYDRVTDMMEIADQKEFATLILETETLLFWIRNKNKLDYLQECRVEDSREEEDSKKWHGKINEIKKQIKRLEFKVQDMSRDIKSVNKKIETLPMTLFSRVRNTYSTQSSLDENDLSLIYRKFQKYQEDAEKKYDDSSQFLENKKFKRKVTKIVPSSKN